jgi:hypothetical protein
MESRDTQTISLRVTAQELADLDAKAAEAGTSRPDYLRARLFAPESGPRIEALEKQLHELTDRLGREAENGGRTCSHRCSNPEHAKIWGVGYCFDCDMPMRSSH